MAFCIQCGETLSLEAKACPACGRPVGQSSIGAAKERQAAPGARKAILVAGGLVALVVVAGLAMVLFGGRRGLSDKDLQSIAATAAPSLVEVEGPGNSAGGVVVRTLGSALLVTTQASVAPAGREVKVSKGGKTVRGFGLLSGKGKVADEFALVLVPEGAALDAQEAKIADRPALDQPLAALADGGATAGAGQVLSFEDGPGAGILVHDAPMAKASRGYGLWNAQGRLAALPALPKAQGDQLAVAASAVFERLLLHEVTIPAGVQWSEHALPMGPGTRVAVALSAPGAGRLEARIGNDGRVVHAQEVWPGLGALELTAQEAGPLQLGGGIAAGTDAPRALVVTFGHL